jgi:hypothetical protein
MVPLLLAAPMLCRAIPFHDESFDETSKIVRQATSDESNCTFQYYDQNIDHFGQHAGTFKQKYSLITKFFKPGGPILFFQGEEGTSLNCVVSFDGSGTSRT